MATASAVRALVAVCASAWAAETWVSAGVAILYLLKIFVREAIVVLSSLATVSKDVSAGYMAKIVW
jgi:hypothetical protein